MAVPKKIKNRYEIKDVVGRGGMGVVYRALDTDPSMRGREVALKTIVESPDHAALELFEKERRVLASLNHPTSSISSTVASLKRMANESPSSSAPVAGKSLTS
jgi:serine/threonine protein kinase